MRIRFEPLSPAASLAIGLAAGAIGSLAQNVYFRATAKITPPPTPGAFDPPEPEQRREGEAQTVARRLVELFLQRGRLRRKELAGKLVHVGFGAAWGAVYGLARLVAPSLRTIGGAVPFGTFVWMASDNLLVPAAKLAAWPQHYPLKTHAYAISAHWAYGVALYAAFEAITRLARPRARVVLTA